jgi:dihydrofolate reductase/thymidylate synthase
MSSSSAAAVIGDGANDDSAKSSSSVKPLQILVAATQRGGIGDKGTMPWPRLAADLAFFLRKTTEHSADDAKSNNTQNAVIMGRKTYDSLPKSKRPLPDRVNIVVSRTMPTGMTKAENGATLFVAPSFEAALTAIDTPDVLGNLVDQVFVIGGADLYSIAMTSPRCSTVYLTSILREYPCDRSLDRAALVTLFDLEDVGDVQTEAVVPFQFQTWKRKPVVTVINQEEQNYLDLVREVIAKGTQVVDRTLVGTRFLFGRELRFSLRNNKFPLYTSKRVPVKSMLLELLWLLKGDTCSERLSKAGCSVWNDNGSRAFLDRCKLERRRVGDLGPIYGGMK